MPTTSHTPLILWCKVHACQLYGYRKHGKTLITHRLPSGQWCTGSKVQRPVPDSTGQSRSREVPETPRGQQGNPHLDEEQQAFLACIACGCLGQKC
jgi:hypothetical protein